MKKKKAKLRKRIYKLLKYVCMCGASECDEKNEDILDDIFTFFEQLYESV